MKKLFIFIFLLILTACNKPKVVLICGDHVCINNSEAEQFFEENLTLEVRLIDKKKSKKDDLVELNLRPGLENKKKINIFKKKKTSQNLVILSNEEIKNKKKLIKDKKRLKNKKLKEVKKSKKELKKTTKVDKKDNNSSIKSNKNVNNLRNEIVDICSILSNCSINEISKYLIKDGKNKEFPDITVRN